MQKQAFSLVELSVVLVILGLITGGIVTGSHLIEAAKMNSVITEMEQYKAAGINFRERYDYMPGDLPNAADIWGAATCPTAAGSGTETCNGDGDGEIDAAPAASRFGETFMFWQHLANADLIEGKYTGMSGSGSADDIDPGKNTPKSKYNGASWCVFNDVSHSGNANWFKGMYRHTLYLGAEGTTACIGAVFTPEVVSHFDIKIDDGMPAQGDLWVLYRTGCTNSSGVADYDAKYLLTNTGYDCAFALRNAF